MNFYNQEELKNIIKNNGFSDVELEIFLGGFLLYIWDGRYKMFKRVFQLFKIGRKFASSGALITVNKIYKLPISIRILF